MADNTRQVSEKCTAMRYDEEQRMMVECGSYYRNGEQCNICGAWAPVEDAVDAKFSYEGRPPIGRIWSKALHRYIS